MGLKISGLNELRERLERLRPDEVMGRALAEQAQRMAARVREGLSEPPSGAGHDEPWLRSGALRDSVGVQADGLQAAVGNSDPAAMPQELGTARMPARPFLAPMAAVMGEEVARAVAAAVVAALRGDSPDAGSARVHLCGDGPDGSDPLHGGAIAGGGAPASTSSAKAPGGGRPSPTRCGPRSNMGGFDPSGVRLASGTDEGREDIEGEEPPGHEHTHHGVHVPEIVPGLHGPDTSSNIPHVPIPLLGDGRGPASAGAGGARPIPVGPSTENLASESGMLRSAAQGKGNSASGRRRRP